MNSTTRLMRSSNDKIISGVCGGLAEYFGIDTTIVRLVFVVAVLSGVSPLLYLILWIVMPQNRLVQPAAQAVAQLPVVAPTTARAASFYEGQENWKYDPISGEKIAQ